MENNQSLSANQDAGDAGTSSQPTVPHDMSNDTVDNGEVGNDADQSGKKKVRTRKHGKGFIYLGLRDADEALRKIDHHAKRMSKDGFARALGHKKAEGRFFNKLDALKQYKLVEDDGDDVVLMPLAVEMLYGGSEAARAKARTTAFLSYEDFSKTFVECPKGQDHPIEYLVDYVKGKLGIANEVDRFKRLFLESAHFAGLLEGEPNPEANTIRLRPATLQPKNGASETTSTKISNGYEVVAGDEASSILDGLGLTAYADRTDVAQRSAGKVVQSFVDGTITLEIKRPVRIEIKNCDLLVDLPEIVKAMRQKGFEV